MMTVHEVSKLTGVSIRTLQYYDKIGLLSPAQYTDAGYRLYDDLTLWTLQRQRSVNLPTSNENFRPHASHQPPMGIYLMC